MAKSRKVREVVISRPDPGLIDDGSNPRTERTVPRSNKPHKILTWFAPGVREKLEERKRQGRKKSAA